MMVVKKTSWHYRLWRFGRENERSRPRDLCRYFWHIALVKVLLPLALAGLALTGVGFILYWIWGHPWQSLAVVVGVAAVAALGACVYLFLQRQEAKQKQRPRQPEPVKDPSPLREYLAARKRKVCPLIKVEE